MSLSNIQVLMDKIYDIKEKISDQEYIDLCNLLNDVRVSKSEPVNNNNEAADEESDDESDDESEDESDDESEDESDEEIDPYLVPETIEAYNIVDFQQKFLNKKYGQYTYDYMLFDVSRYFDKILVLIQEFIDNDNTLELYHQGLLKNEDLIDFLSDHMENTPNDQYPGYSLREFKETFKRRFKGFSNVNRRIKYLLKNQENYNNNATM